VIISPDTTLGTMPFSAMPGREPGSYLIEDYRISLLPMAGLMQSFFDDSERANNKGLLLVGDVNYDKTSGDIPSEPQSSMLVAEVQQLRSGQGKWESLSGFRAEMESVRSLHQQHFAGTSTSHILNHGNATEAAFLQQAPQYGNLHVITHGYFENPEVKSISQAASASGNLSSQRSADPFLNTYLPGLLSGLVMAGANNPPDDPEDPRDGILRASEIEASSMQGVDLVVLSACETGLGAVAGGEGLTGLQRAFHIAGARSVIASLWKVDDRATQILMERFYTNLWQKKMSKIDALREAQLWMLRHPQELEELGVTGAATRGLGGRTQQVDPTKKSVGSVDRTDPFFWAAFQLSGDWR
jgi:CHAT domain-containing protein